MNNILRDEVNQHTSDEVAKVLADLEAQGVDIAALGSNINTILSKLNSGGNSVIKSVQRGKIEFSQSGSSKGKYYTDIAIDSVDPSKAFVIVDATWSWRTGNTTSAEKDSGSVVQYKLTSGTNLRVACLGYLDSTATVYSCVITGSYQVIEFA